MYDFVSYRLYRYIVNCGNRTKSYEWSRFFRNFLRQLLRKEVALLITILITIHFLFKRMRICNNSNIIMRFTPNSHTPHNNNRPALTRVPAASSFATVAITEASARPGLRCRKDQAFDVDNSRKLAASTIPAS